MTPSTFKQEDRAQRRDRPVAPARIPAILPARESMRWTQGERLEHLWERQVEALPLDAIAVDGPAGTLTYRALDARANRLARHLDRRRLTGPGGRVALLFEHPVEAYTAILAALKLHSTYVPLDPGFPPERIGLIAADAGVTLVLSESRLLPRLRELPPGVEVLCVDEHAAAIAVERADRPRPPVEPPADDGLCYVIYTSGTTGRPKGVAISHAAICNFVRVAAESYGVRSSDRMYQGLTIAFDFCFEEIWVAWLTGATLVPRPPGETLVGEDLHAFLLAEHVTALSCVPTVLATLPADLPALRFLLLSGETCPEDLAARWQRPGRRLLNVYGPTEATVSATWAVLEPGRPVTIGTPLPTYSAVVLDRDADRVLGVGELGELGLAGVGLADGYLGRPELTERAFRPDFLSLPANPSGRIYRTGDLVRVNDRGEIEHHGRIDAQVKVRGYRIELEEIEAAIRSLPGVAQAVATTFEPVPERVELAAFFTPVPGCPAPSPDAIAAQLRERLPGYMVPAYLEPIRAVPLMPSGKVDRHALRTPRVARITGPDRHVAPAPGLESILAEEVAAVLGLERVSAEAHLFDDLGANSLLLAQLVARLRRRDGEVPSVSLRDLYLQPTVRRLAMSLIARPGTAGAGASSGPSGWREPVLPVASGKPRRALCGVLQLLAFVGYLGLAGGFLDATSAWLFRAPDVGMLLLRSLACGTVGLLVLAAVPVAAKWILIGRWRPHSIRIWSLAYVRFWIVKTLLVLNPLPHLLVGTPLLPLYLRLLGARVGPRVVIATRHIPVCADLLSIGSDAVIRKDSYMSCYRARAGEIQFGTVDVGQRAFVGEQCVLDIDTGVGDNAQLGHASSLQRGQQVPAGRIWHGSPGQPAPAGHVYGTVPDLAAGGDARRRAFRYGATRMLAILLVLGPLEAVTAGLLLTHPRWYEHLSVLVLPAISAGLLALWIIVSLAVAVGVPRVLGRLLEPGRVYPLYGWRYSVQRLIARSSNNMLLTGLFGDSAAIVHYLRLIGYRLGAVVQTGSNFGMDVIHEVPGLTEIGGRTMASDGLSIMNLELSSTAFRVRRVRIADRNYIGNGVCFPPDGRVGENCLFATKAMVPVAGPIRRDVGLLGSPCFEIPRSVRRDLSFAHLLEEPERSRRLARKLRHNLGTMALYLLVLYLLSTGWLVIARLPLGDGGGVRDWAGTLVTALLELVFMVTLFIGAERAVTGFRPLRPRCCSILEPAFWRHERYWKVAPTGYGRVFDGTPAKPVLWRLLGMRVGRRVFDDGAAISERTLVSIGDDATLGAACYLQSHTLEDGVFKSGHISVGAGSTVSTGALVNYDAVVGEGAVIEVDSFVMKGSRVEAGARWCGNPAAEVPAAGARPEVLPVAAVHPELEAA